MWDKGHAVISAAESHTKGRWQENPVWLALGDKVRPDGHLYLKGAEQCTVVDNGRLSGSGLFCNFFFLQLHCKTKPDLYPQNILIATGKNYALTKLLEKSTARILQE